MIGWNFPSNGGGAINGVANAGVEIFRGKEIPSLAREIYQNSLDAAADENFAVLVEFQRHTINTKDIPAHDDYKKILEDCRAFRNKKSDKAGTFIQETIPRLKFSGTFVLRISDFNTTGLAEPFVARAIKLFVARDLRRFRQQNLCVRRQNHF